MVKSDEGRTVAYWEATEPLIESRHAVPESVDVCIVGGGIAGITTAYLLAKEGTSVAVIDDGLIGGGETCRTTAHLSNAIDDRIYRIEEWHGEEKARLAVEAHTSAIDSIEQNALAESIDCDLVRLDGYLIEAADGEDDLNREFAAARRCGIDVEWADSSEVVAAHNGRCLRFPRQGQFHVLKYLNGLAAAVERLGGRLVSHKRVVEWSGGERPTVKTADGKQIAAGKLVLATNYPLMSKMFAELPAYRTYAIALRIPAGSVRRALVWDTGDPYHYVRTQPDKDGEVLIVGGEDHRTGQANDGDERFERLEQWAREHFPSAGEAAYRWSGQFMETHDGLAFMGRHSDDEPNVLLITGDSGMGMTHGTAGAMLVRELVLDRPHKWSSVFDPSRLATQSITEAVPEVISSTVPYKDWLTPGEISSESELERGAGAVMRSGLKKIAVYRDEVGVVHRRSAVCTHMGCIVRFNSLEKTWDCPCHGSRFSIDGQPINTPAILPLEDL